MTMLYLLDLFGTGVFAVTGSLAAGRKRLDLFGVMVVATATAIGGGTLRDLILGIRPVFWVRDNNCILVSIVAALVTFFIARYLKMPVSALAVLDAFGLAVFTVIGCEVALRHSTTLLIAVVTGAMTGSAGGVLRDILCGDVPGEVVGRTVGKGERLIPELIAGIHGLWIRINFRIK